MVSLETLNKRLIIVSLSAGFIMFNAVFVYEHNISYSIISYTR